MAGLNAALDHLARRDVRVLGRSRSMFRVCGVVGVLAAAAIVAPVSAVHHLSWWVPLAMLVTGAATFLALATAVRWLTGEEQLIYYHHEIAVLTAVALLLWLTEQPLASGLDAAALGLGAFLACGRIGCLSAGCCHGRPATRGARYGPEHAELGLPAVLVGVRLFPLQLVEATLVAATVGAGLVVAVHGGGRPGAAAGLYVVVYAVIRFGLEILRGDPDRRYFAGFSEAQWTGCLILAATAGMEIGGALPAVGWHLAAAAAIPAAMATIAAIRRLLNGRHELLGARHVMAVADTLARTVGCCDRVDVARTPLGVGISSSSVISDGHEVHHYTLSRADRPLGPREARALGRVIVALRHGDSGSTITPGRPGVFHIVVYRRCAAPAMR